MHLPTGWGLQSSSLNSKVESYTRVSGWQVRWRNWEKKEEEAMVYDSRSGGNIFENVGAISCNRGLSRS
jgi:hypothetical protein